jgi:hypothetical protein
MDIDVVSALNTAFGATEWISAEIASPVRRLRSPHLRNADFSCSNKPLLGHGGPAAPFDIEVLQDAVLLRALGADGRELQLLRSWPVYCQELFAVAGGLTRAGLDQQLLLPTLIRASTCLINRGR